MFLYKQVLDTIEQAIIHEKSDICEVLMHIVDFRID